MAVADVAEKFGCASEYVSAERTLHAAWAVGREGEELEGLPHQRGDVYLWVQAGGYLHQREQETLKQRRCKVRMKND